MTFIFKFILYIIFANICNCSIIPDGQGIYRINSTAGNPAIFLTSNNLAVREVIYITNNIRVLMIKLFVFSCKRTIEKDVMKFETIKELPEYSTFYYTVNEQSQFNIYECGNLTSDSPTFKELYERCNNTERLSDELKTKNRHFDVYKKNDLICYKYNNYEECNVTVDDENRILNLFGIEIKDDSKEINVGMIIGIMIGVFILLVIIIVILFLTYGKKRKTSVKTIKSKNENGVRAI